MFYAVFAIFQPSNGGKPNGKKTNTFIYEVLQCYFYGVFCAKGSSILCIYKCDLIKRLFGYVITDKIRSPHCRKQ